MPWLPPWADRNPLIFEKSDNEEELAQGDAMHCKEVPVLPPPPAPPNVFAPHMISIYGYAIGLKWKPSLDLPGAISR